VGKVQVDGDDVLFTGADGVSRLSHELESFDSVSGHLVAWVRVPVLSSVEDTVLYVYYGNPSSGSQESVVDVWDSGFVAVHHLEEKSGVVFDSSVVGNDGVAQNGVVLDAVGRIDGGDSFDGVNDRIALPRVFTSESQFSFEGWFFTSNVSKQQALVSQRDWSSKGVLLQYNSGKLYFYVDGLNVNKVVSANAWHYVVGTFDGSVARLYVDGGAPVSVATSLSWPVLNTSFGDRVDTFNRQFQGSLDEIRLSNVARSQGYITTSYNNQNNVSAFIAVGPEEEIGTGSPVEECIDSDGDGYSISGGDCGVVDCNDHNLNVYPGAVDVCGNGVDENCDGSDSICSTQTDLLVDSSFDASVDSSDLRTNSAIQDWYESRNELPSLLTLDASSVGGNSGKKAKFQGSTSGDVYLTQEFSQPQTGSFSAEWDIYVDDVLSTRLNAAGWMLIGNGASPNADNTERFVYMAFYKNSGGTLDLIAIDRDDALDSISTVTTVASNLNMKQWYNIRVDLNLITDTYDIYVDGIKKATVSSRNAKDNVSYISFAQWDNGAGTFYVDNVKAYSSSAPAASLMSLSTFSVEEPVTETNIIEVPESEPLVEEQQSSEEPQTQETMQESEEPVEETVSAEPELICDDGLDNDGDAEIDCGDLDCSSAVACIDLCGNGVQDKVESCDDGNLFNEDGCSAICVIEENWTC